MRVHQFEKYPEILGGRDVALEGDANCSFEPSQHRSNVAISGENSSKGIHRGPPVIKNRLDAGEPRSQEEPTTCTRCR